VGFFTTFFKIIKTMLFVHLVGKLEVYLLYENARKIELYDV